MKTTETTLGRNMRYLFLVLLCLSFAAWPSSRTAQAKDASSAVAAAVEGMAELYPEGGAEPGPIEKDTIIQPWDSVSTLEKGKLLLRWDNGLIVSMGELSSILYASDEEGSPDRQDIQIMEGILRVSPDKPTEGRPQQYSIETPLASIVPKNPNEFVDFIVEVYPPIRTVVTVISGEVVIADPKGAGWKEKTVAACQSVSIEEGKGGPVIQSSEVANLQRLIQASTIEGTLQAELDQCGGRGYAETEPSYERYIPPDDYYVDYVDYWDSYPYDDIRFIRRYGDMCVILLPGIGYFHIPVPVYPGWVFDPHAFEVYCRHAFLRRALFHDRNRFHDLRMRRRELFNMMHVAQRTGQVSLLRKLQRDLDLLNTRTDLASRRIRRMQQRDARFEQQIGKLGKRLPKGANLRQAITASLASRQNLKAADSFREKLQNDMRLQDRLAAVSRNELAKVRAQIAGEKDPAKRMALRAQMAGIRANLSAGRVPIPQGDRDLRGLMTKLEKDKNLKHQEEIRARMLKDLQRNRQAQLDPAVTPKEIRALKKDVDRLSNPGTRQVLDRRLNEVERSFQTREQFEKQRDQMERLAERAAKETDPAKRNHLLESMRGLAKPLGVAGAAAIPGYMHLQQQRRLERQLAGEKNKEKRSSIQRTLEDLKKKRPEAGNHLAPLIPGRSEAARKLDAQREQMERQLRQQIQDSGRRRDHKLRNEQQKVEDRLRRDQRGGRGPESDRRSMRDIRDQRERARDIQEQQRLEDRRRDAEKRARDEKERARRRDEDRKKQDLQHRQELRSQQERDRKAADMRKHRQEEQKSQAERMPREQQRQQQLRNQQEHERKASEMRRRQQEEQKNQAERMRKEQQRQQEHERKASEVRRRQQEEQKNQAERMRKEQQRQQQLRNQQERERKASEMRRRQQEEQRNQAERMRREQQRQQQLRNQQERERKASEMRRRQQEEQRNQAERARREQMQRQQNQRQQMQRQMRIPQHGDPRKRDKDKH